MSLNVPQNGHALDLRAGELVQVRSEAEILSTLDPMADWDAASIHAEELQYAAAF